MLYKTFSAAVYGIDANIIEVEVDVSGVNPMRSISTLWACPMPRYAKARIECALPCATAAMTFLLPTSAMGRSKPDPSLRMSAAQRDGPDHQRYMCTCSYGFRQPVPSQN